MTRSCNVSLRPSGRPRVFEGADGTADDLVARNAEEVRGARREEAGVEFERLLYIGSSRARQHLVVIAPS
jgi:hypothetical protein